MAEPARNRSAVARWCAAVARAVRDAVDAALREAVGSARSLDAGERRANARNQTAVATFKQYREADGKFYFKLVDGDRVLLQSEGFDSARDAGQLVARAKQDAGRTFNVDAGGHPFRAALSSGAYRRRQRRGSARRARAIRGGERREFRRRNQPRRDPVPAVVRDPRRALLALTRGSRVPSWRKWFDLGALAGSALLFVGSLHWALEWADRGYGRMWQQIVGTSVSYGVFLAALALAFFGPASHVAELITSLGRRICRIAALFSSTRVGMEAGSPSKLFHFPRTHVRRPVLPRVRPPRSGAPGGARPLCDRRHRAGQAPSTTSSGWPSRCATCRPAAISLIDHDRLWFKARIGIDQAQLDRSRSLCGHAIDAPNETLVVQDLDQHPVYAQRRRLLGLRPRFLRRRAAAQSRRSPARRAQRGRCRAAHAGPAATRRAAPARTADRSTCSNCAGSCSNKGMRAPNLQRRHDDLQYTAHHDQLTGLLNRAGLERLRARTDVKRELAAQPYVLLVLDIDHFKRINDQHGHLFGDRVLCAVADAVSRSVRTSDIAARFGGEEFLVVLPDTRLDGGAEIGETHSPRGRAAHVADAGDRVGGHRRCGADERHARSGVRTRGPGLVSGEEGRAESGRRGRHAPLTHHSLGFAPFSGWRIFTTQKRCPVGASITHQRLIHPTRFAPRASSRATSASWSSASISRCTREGCATCCTFDLQLARRVREVGVFRTALDVVLGLRQAERLAPEVHGGRMVVGVAVDDETGESAAVRHGQLLQFAFARSSSIALRKRAASPPVQARWSKVSDSGMILCDSKPPITGVIWWRPLPAAMIATVGGTITGVA
jgi:GGDEF domain-containing protein